MSGIEIGSLSLKDKSKSKTKPMEFTETSLFGGKITARIPTNFIDISKWRYVPDNQEVRVSHDQLDNIIFDLGQFVAEKGVRTDHEAFAFHIEDLLHPDDRICIGSFDRVTVSTLPHAPAYTAVAMTKPKAGEKGFEKGTGPNVNFVATWMLMVRLREVRTDILLSVNVPYEILGREEDIAKAGMEELLGPFAEPKAEKMEAGYEMLEAVIQSLDVVDWDLFVDDD